MAKKSYRRELIEWTVLISVGLTLYLTGWHTEVIGQIQRVVLTTGLMKPDLEVDQQIDADYNFRINNVAGRTLHFSEFQGETIFLNFWATWCPPCIAEMPDIENLYQSVGDSVQFVMISLDENPEKAKAFVRRKGFELPIYFLNSSLPQVYNPKSIPTTYVISPDQRIVSTRHGMAKYNTTEFRDFLRSLHSTQ